MKKEKNPKSEYRRTTITLPDNIYRQVKRRAKQSDTTVSGYIAGILEQTTTTDAEAKPLPWGKYKLGEETLSRRNVYETHLRSKVSR